MGTRRQRDRPHPVGRNPFEVAILLACVMFGLTGLFAYDEVATNSLRTFPELWGKVFLGIDTSFSHAARQSLR